MYYNVIYLVVGETGEHGDFRHWIVAAFTDRESAYCWRSSCQKHADAFCKKDGQYDEDFRAENGDKLEERVEELAIKHPLRWS